MDIIDGTMPPGAPLVQEQIAAKYGVSRTPVRDALVQIAADGLATAVPGQGYVVNELTDHDVHNVYEVRQALEVLAATQACGLHTPRQLVRLKSLIDEYETVDHSDAEELFRLGTAFHSALVEPSPNEYLLKLLEGVWAHPVNRRISRTLDYTPEQQATVASDHRRILDALGRNDAGAMVQILAACFHIRGEA
ncbi:DNA-binding GntR family transcriptional regulator [Arthrobacter ginsengisoli]|uniref:DNA-binding GntR family transcriptional regulator n=2 Tax=Arthrobacter ginsengisoli TaxID=1356565 RepID=A0ABU1UE61_9MICC|nr:DNA-binding GntR family transcriptional regulator [Arthrobacter ginsengisoli]